nr:RHS repeat-associated core domain-containing protein [Kineosporia babensis]
MTVVEHRLETRSSLETGDVSRSARERTTHADPIDVVTGQMILPMLDLCLPGVLDLVLDRTYLSGFTAGRWFGPGWSSPLDDRLEIDAEGVYASIGEGVLLRYPPVEPGDSVLPTSGSRRWPLSRNDEGEYRLLDPATGRIRTFASAAGAGVNVLLPLAAITDLHGNRISYSYAPDGALTGILMPGDVVLEIQTHGGRVTGLGISGESPLLAYEYDNIGQLTAVVNSSGEPLRFSYDDQGRLTRWTDRNGAWYEYTYASDSQQVVAMRGRDGMLSGRMDYHPAENFTLAEDSLGNVTRYEYNQLHQVTAVTDPLGNTVRTEWDEHDRKLLQTDALGRSTTFRYEDDLLVEVVRPDGLSARWQYTERGRLEQAVAPDGGIQRLVYDEQGNLAATTDQSGAVTRFGYSENGALISITEPSGATTRSTVDARGLPTSVTDHSGETTRIERNALGQVTASFDPLGLRTSYTWTPENKLSQVEGPDGSLQSWQYDAEGNLLEHTDTAGRVTRTEYTGFDLPVVMTNAAGASVRLAYDTELRLSSVTDARGLVWQYEYDAAGRLIRESDYDNRNLTYAYDAAGQLTQRTNAVGETINFQRDALGRTVSQQTERGTTVFTYDVFGRLTRATSPDTDLELTRDARGQIIAEIHDGRILASRYDATGHKVERSTPTGALSTWSYGPHGLATQLNSSGHHTTFQYDATRHEIARNIPGANLFQTWSTQGHLQSQRLLTAGSAILAALLPESTDSSNASSGGRLLQERRYHYRPGGGLTQISDLIRGRLDYDLDPLDQVLAVRNGGNLLEQYAYDPACSLANAGPANGPWEHQGDRVRRAGPWRYNYDGQGRLIRRHQNLLSGGRHTWTYEWDALDHLRKVTTPEGDTWEYRYDALHRRVGKKRLRDGDTVEEYTYAWDGYDLAEQTHVNHADETTTTTVWDWDPTTPRALTQRASTKTTDRDDQSWIDAEFYSIISDLVGTPTELISTDGRIAWQRQTSLWGSGQTTTGDVDCPLAFPGQIHDPETGLNYNVHRYYDPHLGAYISPDPLGLRPGPNNTHYVTSPLQSIDPLGLMDCRIPLYRGTTRWIEHLIHDQTGMILSDSGHEPLLNGDLSAALAASEATHARALKEFGTLDNYVQQHSLIGDDMHSIIGGRSLISTTTDPTLAAGNFAKGTGPVFRVTDDAAVRIPQTLTTSTEAEVLIPHMFKAERLSPDELEAVIHDYRKQNPEAQ